MIRGLARSLQKHQRRTDVPGRYGGKKFAALLHNTAPGPAAARLDHIRERFGATPFDGTAASSRSPSAPASPAAAGGTGQKP
ncbi:MAG: Diguanylate cyclase domain protein [Roseomonas sp.]|nr:Diguanylate cyclase domain protein [Roseomonas sp.]